MRLGSALCMECQLGSAWQSRPARPPTESELMAMSRRYYLPTGHKINQTSFRQVPRRGASASRLGRNDDCSVCLGKHLVGGDVVPQFLDENLPPKPSYGMASEWSKLLVRSSDFLFLVQQCH